MACNLIMNDSGIIRTTQFNSNSTYDVGDINFYLPASKAANHQVFLMMKNKKNLYEIVELVRSKSATQSGSNVLYKLPLNQTLRINNDQATLRLMLINIETDEYIYSSELKVNISTEHYALARQVYIAQQVGQKVQDLYMRVLALTEENKELYKKIQEGDSK